MRCWFHKWGKWETFEKIMSTVGVCDASGKIIRYTKRFQRRKCEKCNKTQIESLDD